MQAQAAEFPRRLPVGARALAAQNFERLAMALDETVAGLGAVKNPLIKTQDSVFDMPKEGNGG